MIVLLFSVYFIRAFLLKEYTISSGIKEWKKKYTWAWFTTMCASNVATVSSVVVKKKENKIKEFNN